MTSSTFFFFFIPLLALVLLSINFIFAPHNPYQEKNGAFECGFTSFLGQNRTQFSISFFIFALLFLLFDLEILLVYPYLVSSYNNESYGLVILLIFLAALTLGFVFELGKKALNIDSRQTISKNTNINVKTAMIIPLDLSIVMVIYQAILNKVTAYMILHFDILVKYLFSILLHYFFKFVMPHISDIKKQPFIVTLSMQLIILCFFTLSYSAFLGYYDQDKYNIAIILTISWVALNIGLDINLKNKYPMIYFYIEIFLITLIILSNLYLMFRIINISFIFGNSGSGGGSNSGSSSSSGGGSNQGGGPNNGGGPPNGGGPNNNVPYHMTNQDRENETRNPINAGGPNIVPIVPPHIINQDRERAYELEDPHINDPNLPFPVVQANKHIKYLITLERCKARTEWKLSQNLVDQQSRLSAEQYLEKINAILQTDYNPNILQKFRDERWQRQKDYTNNMEWRAYKARWDREKLETQLRQERQEALDRQLRQQWYARQQWQARQWQTRQEMQVKQETQIKQETEGIKQETEGIKQERVEIKQEQE